jgi:hypothetical protein
MDDATQSGVSHVPVNTIILAFTADPWKLDIKATVQNYEMALAMLDQARRWFQAQVQAQHAMQIAQQLAESANNERIASLIRNGHR